MSDFASQLESVRALAPELALGLAAFAALLGGGRRGSARAGWIVLAGLGAAAVLAALRMRAGPATVFAAIEVDRFAAFFQLLMTAGCAVVAVTWMSARDERRALGPEEGFLLLAGTLGGFVMVGARHALVLVLGLEILSLACSALAGSGGARPANGEAAMKHRVTGGFATALLLYGLSLLYGLAGTLDLVALGSGQAASGAPGLAQELAVDPWPFALALVLVLAGLASKLALVPLHFSAPDVIEGSPTPASAFLVVVARVAGFGALLRVLAALFVHDHVAPALAHFAERFGGLLAILAVATLAAGSLAMLRPTGLKRLLAYSAVAQTGFAMLGVACLSETGFAAALVCLALSTAMHAGAFAAAVFVERSVGSERLEDLRGLGRHSPRLGTALAILLASAAGFPPLAGFYGKFRVLAEAWNAGLGAWVLAGVLGALVGAFACFQVTRALFLDEPPERELSRARAPAVIAFVLALAVLALGIRPTPVDRWAASALDLLRTTAPLSGER